MRTIFLIAMLSFGGCREYQASMKVLKSEFTLKNPTYEWTPAEGDHEVRIKLASSKREPAILKIPGRVGSFELKLPPAEDFLNIVEAVRIPASDLGQDFNVTIQREIQKDEDDYAISLSHSVTDEVLATILIQGEGSKILFDESSGAFLASYQKVKYSQRGLLFAVDAGKRFPWPGMEGVISSLAHFFVMVMYAPWIYSRYPNVEWLIGEEWGDAPIIQEKWTNLFKESPVVDYFALLHGNLERAPLNLGRDIPRKRNQLRVGYAQGCETGAAGFMISDDNFAVASGYRANSNSPFYTFALFRNWVYGRNYSEALDAGSRAGIAWQKLLGFEMLVGFWGDSYGSMPWKNFDDMIYQSEPMVSFTRELKPDDIAINLSAVPLRDTEEKRIIFETGAEDIREYHDSGKQAYLKPW